MKRTGFTLIELTVAVAILAVFTTLAYGAYNTSIHQTNIARGQMMRFQQLQTAIRLLTQDFEQVAPRPVRDLIGDSRLPAVQTDASGKVIVALTRNGWTNPAGLPRSTLQRVMYIFEDGTLQRQHWAVLDATLSNEVIKRDLIDRVKSVNIRYLHDSGQWQKQWPPTVLGPLYAPRSRPIAVEIKLDLEDLGEITRLVEVGR